MNIIIGDNEAGKSTIIQAIDLSIFNILVAIIMSVMMSLVLTLVNVGLISGFMGIWFKSFLVAVIVAIPVTFITIPLVAKILSFLYIENVKNY